MHFPVKLHRLFFKSGGPPALLFDVSSIILILFSVFIVCLSSVQSIQLTYGSFLDSLEWGLTFLFTVEYCIRFMTAPKPKLYLKSFFGIIDLVSVLPTYVLLFFPAGQFLGVIRILRVMRVFRILKLFKYVAEMQLVLNALMKSARKIIVFF